MNLVTGAMGALLPKLAELLKEEYKLKKNVKLGVRSLEKEMKSMHAALRKVAEVPRDQLDEQVKLWAEEVRELSFDMEDVIDKFLVRVDDGSEPTTNSNKLKRLIEMMAGLFTKGKARHQIANAIKEINKKIQDVSNRRGRYTVDNIVPQSADVTPIDPRLGALYKDVTELVGIAGKRDQDLLKLLSEGDSEATKKLKIVSVVGFGGLGKTTLVKTVYDKIKRDFDCVEFVPVGRNADAKRVFRDILIDLGIYRSQFTVFDERQLIDKLRECLENKRYLIVIDDIWDEKLWSVINWAFTSRNNFGSRLITTTRIVSVSKLCCLSANDSVYQMEPLSDDDSKRLFYKRIFSEESRCPREFEEVSTSMLKKCGGVPLAIITIASLLASGQQVKHVEEWYTLLESIGCGLTEDPCVEEMMRILSFSYYDLPSHLKTCLLYLSMFPEDYEIKKYRLIWMWIAESFIQGGKEKISLFETGETYFNELVNRNLIQPIYGEGTVKACRVHDMVLDLILSLSSENNFVTVLNGVGDSMTSQRNVRRLSLQNARKGELETRSHLKSMNTLQVRSILTFEHAIELMPPLSSFVVLRVLDLTRCDLSDVGLRGLGSLFHLRYLGLSNTDIPEIPEEVGNLQFLQVLDVTENDGIKELPSTVSKLRGLMCLLLWSKCTRISDGLGNLTSMEVLSVIQCDSVSSVNALGSMVRLRRLGIRFEDLSLELEEALVESLSKLPNVQSVKIRVKNNDAGNGSKSVDHLGQRWVAPRSLQEFEMDRKFTTLPSWIKFNPWHLSQLTVLNISVEKVGQQDMEIFGRLPALRGLVLMNFRQSGLLRIGADGFRCLTTLQLLSSLPPGQILFQPGALPKAESVMFFISIQVPTEEAAVRVGDCFDLGLGNLPSLRDVFISCFRSGVTVGEAKQVKAELENSLGAHPRHPTCKIFISPVIPRDVSDDDVHIEKKRRTSREI